MPFFLPSNEGRLQVGDPAPDFECDGHTLASLLGAVDPTTNESRVLETRKLDGKNGLVLCFLRHLE
jgi:hypothetical protein